MLAVVSREEFLRTDKIPARKICEIQASKLSNVFQMKAIELK